MNFAKPDLLLFDRVLSEEKQYWTEKLAQETEPSNLSLDYPRPARYSGEQESIAVKIPPEAYRKLTKLTGNKDFLHYTILMTCLKICLYRYTENGSIIVGSPARARNDDSEQPANQLVAILDRVDSALTFRQLLLNVRATLLEAYARQRYRFDRLVRDLGLEGGENRCPLFDIVLALTNIHRGVPDAKNDLTMIFSRADERLEGKVVFNRALFKRETIERFTQHFVNVLVSALENTDAPISELQILSEAERRRLLVDWNRTRAAFPQDKCVHQLFEEQVALTPQAVAVVFQDKQIGYEEINRGANKLARTLSSFGVGEDTVVALLDERGIDLLTAMLAVFKAGGAYLPLDPSYPPDRLSQLLKESKAPLIVTADEFVPVLIQALSKTPAEHQPQVMKFSDLRKLDECGDNLSARSGPGNLAYVIYTSGSTGVPKGAMIEHRGLLNHLNAKILDLKLTAADSVAQTASQCFDISVWQFLAVLLAGGRVHICGDDVAHSPSGLLEEVERARITIVETVPSLLRGLLDECEMRAPDRFDLSSLRWLIPTGEALPPQLCREWFDIYPEIPLLNAYGPTECSDDVTHYFIREGPPFASIHMPIGRPVANMRLHVLDRRLEPKPTGVEGELYVGGIGVGRGYLHDPARTADGFIPDPFSPQAGARLYKTGDLARYLSDGNIEFLGRIDHQVKVRGFRIELGEIEVVLSQHPALHECVVVDREDSLGDKHLVAYLVALGEATPSVSELRSYLLEKLPDYMVPSRFVMMESLPLSPNGKLDRKALPDPDPTRYEFEDGFTPPRTPTEEVLVGIWSQVLGEQRISVTDNFFRLGGHSLLATQVISRVQNVFPVQLPLRLLFESPTVGDLAAHIDRQIRMGQGIETPPIGRMPRGGGLPMSFAQQRMWYLYQLGPESPVYNISAAVHMVGPLNYPALEQTLNEITRRHESLRTSFSDESGEPLQQIALPMPVALPIVEVSEIPGQRRDGTVRQLAAEQARRPFNLMQGPLLRVTLLRMRGEEHVIVFTMHHIISDGWSMGLLVGEVTKLYQTFSKGDPSPLPDLAIQYADFAQWQRQWLQGEVYQRQVDYWRKQLTGLTPLRLPTDRRRPAVQTYRGGRQLFALSSALSNSLQALSRQEGVTLFMTLLAAFQTLLHRYTGQEDIVVGTNIANRNRADIEPILGFFVNNLVMRTDFSGNPTFRQLFSQVREVALGAYAHQDLPFEKLVQELQPERDLSHNPLFQVLFALQDFPEKDLSLPGLTLSYLDAQNETAMLDIILNMINSEHGLRAALRYNTDLFEEATIVRFIEHFKTLLEDIVSNPDQCVSTFSIVAEDELEILSNAFKVPLVV